jgi:hypothetical protein
MRLRCERLGLTWEVDGCASIGRAEGADVSIAEEGLLPRHAVIAATETRPRAWFLVSACDADQVEGRPVVGGIARLGGDQFSARIVLGGRVELQCENAHRVKREAANGAGPCRCARCARPILEGEAIRRCECGAVPVHDSCFEGKCYRCGVVSQGESDGE